MRAVLRLLLSARPTDSGEQLDADEDGSLVVPARGVDELAGAVNHHAADEHELEQALDPNQVGLGHARVVSCHQPTHTHTHKHFYLAAC